MVMVMSLLAKHHCSIFTFSDGVILGLSQSKLVSPVNEMFLNKNNGDPKTAPWGTPRVIFLEVDL